MKNKICVEKKKSPKKKIIKINTIQFKQKFFLTK